jgi:hypothetical protein
MLLTVCGDSLAQIYKLKAVGAHENQVVVNDTARMESSRNYKFCERLEE